MRLLNVSTLEFKEFHGESVPKYVVASHRWTEDETTYHSFARDKAANSRGYQKVVGFCSRIQRSKIDVQWLWIDTCCIDKSSSAELTEAINSMFRWYQTARVCYVHLNDVKTIQDFRQSNWFTRGWTLQELLAPRHVVFFGHDWQTLGYKGPAEPSDSRMLHLNAEISLATGIPENILRDFNDCERFSVNERLSWMINRETTRPEDKAYSLLGIFGVFMTVIYGEGYRHAYRRLMKEIESLNDGSWQRSMPNPISSLGPTALGSNQGVAGASDSHNDSIFEVNRQSTTLPRTNHLGLPIGSFQYREAGSNRLFMVVSTGQDFQVVYDDGRLGNSVPIYSGLENARQMKEMWIGCGSPTMDPSKVSARQGPIAKRRTGSGSMASSTTISQIGSGMTGRTESQNEVKPEIRSEIDDRDTKPPATTFFGLPKDSFKFRDRKTKRMYTVVKNDRYYQVYYEDGERGARAAVSDGFTDEPQIMKDLWEACGSITETVNSSGPQLGPSIRNIEFYY